MKKKNCLLLSLKSLSAQKRIVVFGLSNHLINFIDKQGDFLEICNIDYVVDNNESLQGTQVCIANRQIDIKAPSQLVFEKDIMVLIATAVPQNIISILHQLESMNLDDSIECYSLYVIEATQNYDDSIINKLETRGHLRIEKVIHSFWFSGEEKPKKYQECIDSWKRYCPDYKIIEWNSDNYDVTKNKYMLQAYERKRWAFVSDFARLDVVYNQGGIYLDMDVELLKSLDSLPKVDAFFSFDSRRYIDLGSGFGAVKGHPLVGKLLKNYDNLEFEENLQEGKMAMCQPTRLLTTFEEFGFKKNNKSQLVQDVLFMSPNLFRIFDSKIVSKNNLTGSEYAIHWHNAGWWNQQMRDKRDENASLMKKIIPLFGD